MPTEGEVIDGARWCTEGLGSSTDGEDEREREKVVAVVRVGEFALLRKGVVMGEYIEPRPTLEVNGLAL